LTPAWRLRIKRRMGRVESLSGKAEEPDRAR